MDLFDAPHQASEVEGVWCWVREAMFKVKCADGEEIDCGLCVWAR